MKLEYSILYIGGVLLGYVLGWAHHESVNQKHFQEISERLSQPIPLCSYCFGKDK